jgi:hypothetical protein
MADVAVMAPIAALCCGGLYLATRKSAKTPPRREPSKEEQHRHQMILEMHTQGATAAGWQVLHNKAVRMGGALTEYEFPVHNSGRGRTPDVNPAEHLFQEHATLYEFDRDDTFLAAHTVDGEIRPGRRNPTITSLTPEVQHPTRPELHTTFGVDKHFPNYLNDAQHKQVLRILDEQLIEDQQLRRHYDMPYFTRAPGVSYRYEE